MGRKGPCGEAWGAGPGGEGSPRARARAGADLRRTCLPAVRRKAGGRYALHDAVELTLLRGCTAVAELKVREGEINTTFGGLRQNRVL